MMTKRVNQDLLNTIKGYGERTSYDAPYTLQPEGTKNENTDGTLKGDVRRDKMVSSIKEVIEKVGLKDGMTVSFAHHFRNGDKTLTLVMDVIAEMGFKNIRIAASSFTSAHDKVIDYIRAGVVNRIESSGLRGELAAEVSRGVLGDEVAVIRSHGGRARAIVSGDLKIDVAFIGASSADCMGNANGVKGKSRAGSLGYAMVDAAHADKVVILTDTIVPYPNFPGSIPQTQVDYVVEVDEIGDPNGIATGATRATKNPKELLMAKKVLEAMVNSRYFVDGFSMQTGSGGAALAVTRFIKDELIKRGMKCSFGLGGTTQGFVDLLEAGLIGQIFDTQCFDLAAIDSIGKNEKHVEISADFYANPHNESPAVNKLDFVVLSALEIDKEFNVNVISGSDGIIRAAAGGHPDTAAGAKVSIIVAPLTRGRIPTILNKVTTVVTPGSTIDVVVTEYGICVNPQRTDLIEDYTKAGLTLVTMEELIAIANDIVGEPKEIEFEDKIVAVIEYRDGSIIDVVRKIKED